MSKTKLLSNFPSIESKLEKKRRLFGNWFIAPVKLFIISKLGHNERHGQTQKVYRD
jgi:hypothetical protein